MMKVKDILEVKGKVLVTINQNETIFDALETFAKNRVGSLIVLDDNNNTVGIIAPRDVLTNILNQCEQIKQTKVSEVMTKDIIVGTPEDNLEYVQMILTENRIRHLPIIDQNQLVGIISIGDVVKAQLHVFDAENRYLRDYMVSKYPA